MPRCPVYAPSARLDPADVRRRVLALRDGGGTRLSKRAVDMPSDEERQFSQGAALYGCVEGHSWLVYLLRAYEGGFQPVDPAHVYCTEDPCASGSDEAALGEKLSGIRFWTMRR